jgi:sulfate/thiosulfate transport system substrate-binding protein
VVDKHGTRKQAEAYVEYHYSSEGQDIAGKHFFRPRQPEAAQKYASRFGNVKLFTIEDVFGGWKKAQATHFADGGIFDQIYTNR